MSEMDLAKMRAAGQKLHSVRKAPEICVPLPVGPENPVRVLPPGLLSRTLVAFEGMRNNSNKESSSRNKDLVVLLAIVFDLARDVFGYKRTGRVAIYRNGSQDCYLLLYDTLVLKPNFDNGALSKILLQSRSDNFDSQHDEVACWRNLRDQVVVSGNASIGSHDTQGAIVCAAREVLKNCPYSFFTGSTFHRKWRARIVKLVCVEETAESVEELEKELWGQPRLVRVPGWCGGIALHPCCRLGNCRQLRVFLDALSNPGFQAMCGDDPGLIINWRNIDGCTPLYIANLYRQKSISSMLLKAGADPTIGDRFSGS
jgi:hypothetical protein